MSIYGVQIDTQPTQNLRERLNSANLTNKQMQSFGNDINDVKTQLEKMNEKINRLNDILTSKCSKDDLIDLKSNYSQLKQKNEEMENVMSLLVNKQDFKIALDDISSCFEDYVLNAGNTPRINLDGFEKRMSMIEEKLNSLSNVPKVHITRNAMDTDLNIPSLEIQKSDSLFRKPVKMEKK